LQSGSSGSMVRHGGAVHGGMRRAEKYSSSGGVNCLSHEKRGTQLEKKWH